MIQFLSKYNKVQQLYAEKTGLIVPVGVIGTNVEPTPEPDDTFHFNIRIVKENGFYQIYVTSNIPAPVDNASVYITDEPSLGGCVGDYTTAFEGNFIPTTIDPLVWVSDDYVLNEGEAEDGCGYNYIATADWIDGTVTDGDYIHEHSMSGTWELVN